ncbi:MAG: DUF1549 domain-containing protein [Planctomycetes bacterium]|nr:DUF1549 domain-containing protein [Planctomycetota bacterium]
MKRIFLAALVCLGLPLTAWANDPIAPASQRFAGTPTAEVPSFQRHVLPVMGRLGCNGRACHGSFQGQGGFRLSLFGYDFKMDHDALLKGDEPRVDLKNAAKSLMLTKPTGTEDDHGGGHKLDVDSWQYRLIKRWIDAGAPATDENKDPQFVRLEVTPAEIVYAKPGQTTQLRALSYWSDGTIEDVTPLCRFQANDESVAKVDANGLITSLNKGDTHIVAFYDNGVVPVSVMLPVSDKTGPNYPSVPTPTKIDELVVTKLRKLGIVPAELCNDGEFIRRVTLDITGQLPTATEVTEFLADKSSDKRAKKIDELLTRPAYAAWWATKFSDLLGNNENQLRVINNGKGELLVDQWYRWLVKRLDDNLPYDRIIEGMVLASGRSSKNQTYEEYCKEMVGYYFGDDDYAERETMPHYWARRNMKKPNEKALSFSYAFLGVRLQCAECHKHPFDQWSQQDFQQFTAFFNRIDFGTKNRDEYNALMDTLGMRNKKLGARDVQEIVAKAVKEGKVVPIPEVYVAVGKTPRQRGSDKDTKRVEATRVITPKVLGGEEVVENEIDDPREPLMAWLRQQDNPYFAKAIVNRVWAAYFNVGIVEPPDDMNLANAPSNKALIDWLADAFVEHNYDLKWLHRTIANSRTYQLGWHTNETNELDIRNFSHSVPRRMAAEMVYDAVTSATAGGDELKARAANPAEKCAIGNTRGYTRRGGGGQYALTVFGKPMRETPCDCERSNEPSLLQTVFLRNDKEMFSMIERQQGWLSQVAGAQGEQAKREEQVKQRAKALEDLRKVQTEMKQVNAKLATLDNSKKSKGERDRLTSQRERLSKTNKQMAEKLKGMPEVSTAAKKRPSNTEAINEAYLRTFARRPTSDELANAEQYVRESTDARTGLRDLMWALLNSKEFLVNH